MYRQREEKMESKNVRSGFFRGKQRFREEQTCISLEKDRAQDVP